jgi:predicted branched-subunit amino acid permease
MFPAAFLALLAPQLTGRAARTAAIYGGLLAIAIVPFVPVGVPVLAAVLGVIPGVRAMRRASGAPA